MANAYQEPSDNATDDILCKVADEIYQDSQVEKLGKRLGLPLPAIRRFCESNRSGSDVTTHGTKQMLRSWAEQKSSSQILPSLRAALIDEGLVRIAERCVPGSWTSNEHEILSQNLQPTLVRCYKTERVRIKPWQKKSFGTFEDSHVNIAVYIKESPDKGSRTKKTHFKGSLSDVFVKKLGNSCPTHILLLGAAGHGKTTALAKFAHDWAYQVQGAPLLYLFLLKLRGADKDSSLGDVILAQLLCDIHGITPVGIEHFIKTHQSQCCFLLDGYDEFSGSIVADSPKPCNTSLAKLMMRKDFPESRVLVTSRHYTKDDFESGNLPMIYLTMEIEGFTQDDVKVYISKYFQDTPSQGVQLMGLIMAQYTLASLVSIPFFCMAMCSMKEAGFLKYANTLTKLFEQLIVYLVHHTRSKVETDAYSTSRVNSMISAVGDVALRSLVDDKEKLIFSLADFEYCKEQLDRSIQIGLLSQEKCSYDPVELSDEEPSKITIEFFHKMAQEYCAGCYLAHLEPNERNRVLGKLDNNGKIDGFGNVLRFAAGSSSDSLTDIVKHIKPCSIMYGTLLPSTNHTHRLLLDLLSESTDSVGGALTPHLTPHFEQGIIELYRATGNTINGRGRLPDLIKSKVR